MLHNRQYVVVAALMLSLFLASMEATVVATAMPTIVADLGGLSIYAWVFSAYMLASTTMVPIFGKLSDIFGRRPVYLVSITIFLVGSTLCGFAQSMAQLVLFRAIQGLGAGGILPLVFTIIGDMFSFEERARLQGFTSGVWGVSSVVGPLLGGFLVDNAGWQWVFFVNLPTGLIAITLMMLAWRDVTPRTRAQVDFLGAGLLGGAIVSLLLALFQLNQPRGWELPAFALLLALSAALFVALFFVERRAPNPILPIWLFRERLFATGTGHGFLAGFAIFGSTAFVPFFAQAVLGLSATAAGATLMPLILMWTIGSIIGARLLLRLGYRSIALVGMTLSVAGAVAMTALSATTPSWFIMLNGALIGIGMGFSVPAFLISVQTSVPKQSLGTATATLQFSRNIGGTIGTSVLGVVLTLRLDEELLKIGIDPKTISIGGLLEKSSSTNAAQSLAPLRDSLAHAVQSVFVVALLAAMGAWIATSLTPRGRIEHTRTPTERAGQTAE